MYDKSIVSDDNRKQEASADHRLLDFPGNLNHIMSIHISFHIICKRILLVGRNRDINEIMMNCAFVGILFMGPVSLEYEVAIFSVQIWIKLGIDS